ncbi:hypothetical protein TWF696_001852 [Orbilia brochopaga]|uniref:Uncharacterized protein n=1 Tax=Orbilia brochopaga TaxID=3140254 RepID=A0AAV9U6K3_9PEZI
MSQNSNGFSLKGAPPPYSEEEASIPSSSLPRPRLQSTSTLDCSPAIHPSPPPPPYSASEPPLDTTNTVSLPSRSSSRMSPSNLYHQFTRAFGNFVMWLIVIVVLCSTIYGYAKSVYGERFGEWPTVAQVVAVALFVLIIVTVTIWWPVLSGVLYKIWVLLRDLLRDLLRALLRLVETLLEIFPTRAEHRGPASDLELGSVLAPSSPPSSAPQALPPSPQVEGIPSRSTARLLRHAPPLRFPSLNIGSLSSPAAWIPPPSPHAPESPQSSGVPRSAPPSQTDAADGPSSGTRSGHARKRSKGGSKDD